MTTKIYKNKKLLAEGFAQDLLEFLEKNPGDLHLALSGGSTPKVIFTHLSEQYKNSIPWERIHFYWGDERCVPPDHEQSNYKMTVDYLFNNLSVSEKNIHRIRGEADPEKEARRYAHLLDTQLPMVHGVPQLDWVILGMGDDGHTASIFPYNIELWDSDSWCEVAAHPDSGQLRVTVTGDVINNAKKVSFLVTGANKKEKVKDIFEKAEGHMAYPASLVDPQTGDLIWYLDEAAFGVSEG